jgi:hypothetical protein
MIDKTCDFCGHVFQIDVAGSELIYGNQKVFDNCIRRGYFESQRYIQRKGNVSPDTDEIGINRAWERLENRCDEGNVIVRQ